MNEGTYTVSFDHMVHSTPCKVDAAAHYDYDGVYKTEILAVWFEGVNVAELIDTATLCDIDARIEDECHKDWANR